MVGVCVFGLASHTHPSDVKKIDGFQCDRKEREGGE